MSYVARLGIAASALIGAAAVVSLVGWLVFPKSAPLNAGRCKGPDPFIAYWRTTLPPLGLPESDGGERSVRPLVVSSSDRCVEAHCRNGVWDGEWRAFYRDGGLAQQGSYRRGLRIGQWVRFGEDGGVLGTVTFKGGDGRWVDWYSNGAKAEEGDFVDGEQSGTWRYWSDDGVLLGEAEFAHGLRDGKAVSFGEDGGIAHSVWYIYGRRADAGEPHPKFVPRLIPSADVAGCGP